MPRFDEALLSQGFTLDEASRSAAQQNADAQGMSVNGPYVVESVHVKGDVLVSVERNQSPEDLGGYTALVTHPALAVVTSPKGRIACNPNDVELVLSVVGDLS